MLDGGESQRSTTWCNQQRDIQLRRRFRASAPPSTSRLTINETVFETVGVPLFTAGETPRVVARSSGFPTGFIGYASSPRAASSWS